MFFPQAASERVENGDKLKTRAEAMTPRPACYYVNVKGCSSNDVSSGELEAQMNIDGLRSLPTGD